jgi:cbb3-type cytochrome oxidase subunit 3
LDYNFTTNIYNGNPAKLTPTMKASVLTLLIVASVFAAVIVLVVIYIYWPSGDEEVDEENPLSLDQSREARESQRRDSGDSGNLGAVFFLLLSPIFFG